MSLASFIIFVGVFIALVVLSLLIIAGIGIWADQVPGAQPEHVRLMMVVVSFAAMLAATAGFIIHSVEEALRAAIRQLELRMGD
jgi:thiosulfate reductase cytochrome b subunit